MQSHFEDTVCECGRKHINPVGEVITESGAVCKLPEVITRYGGKSVFILADKNTYKAAGETVCAVLSASRIPYSSYIFQTDTLEPDEAAVGAAVMHFDAACDIICAVGSGVINDIGKILSKMAGKPYIVVATAPSMDGYASETSSMAVDGLKVSLPTRCADVIIGDLDILSKAPLHLLRAGLGDMLAKYISIGEWRIAHRITGEYYCEKVATLIREAVSRCVKNAEGLLERDPDAVRAVFEGLILGGVCMAYAGVSRPASGAEHYFSHVWDMRGLSKGTPVALHGTQCALGTLLAARFYDVVRTVSPDREKALAFVSAFDYKKHAEKLRAFLGKGAEAMILLEEKEQKYSKTAHEKRLEIILKAWDEIMEIINEEIPHADEIERILETIGAPKSLEEIGLSADIIPDTFSASRDIRDKYVLSRLAWDLGITDEILTKGIRK